MSTFLDLVNNRAAYIGRDIQFKKDIEICETYAESDMKATIIGISLDTSIDVVKVHVNYSKFDDHNRLHESSNYYDYENYEKNKNPCLTARQAGYYKVDEELYFDLGQKVEEMFKILSTNFIYEEYLTSKKNEQSYVQWLEEKVSQLSK